MKGQILNAKFSEAQQAQRSEPHVQFQKILRKCPIANAMMQEYFAGHIPTFEEMLLRIIGVYRGIIDESVKEALLRMETATGG